MIIKADNKSYFVFDLDDTLYPEIEYLKSAFHFISKNIDPGNCESLYEEMLNKYFAGSDAFGFLLEKFHQKNLTLEKLLYLYRTHYPNISLREGVLEMLIEIRKRNGMTGIITDGRSITQRNKIRALGLEKYFDQVLISEEFGAEKPSVSLFTSFMGNEKDWRYYYIGDNLRKDFITPKKLNWCCIGVLDVDNIHDQKLSDFSAEMQPHHYINKFTEIEIV